MVMSLDLGSDDLDGSRYAAVRCCIVYYSTLALPVR